MLPDSELRRPAPAVPAELRQWLPLPNYRDFIENIRADHWYFTKTWHHNIFRRKRQALFTIENENHYHPQKHCAGWRWFHYIITGQKGKRFIACLYSIPQPTLYHNQLKMASTFDPRKRHAGSPLPFFQYVSIIQVSGKMASIFFYIICLPFSGIHV